MRSKKQLKTPITPLAGQKGDAQVKGAAPDGANRHDPAQKRGNRLHALMPPDLRKASDLGGVVHAHGEVDAPATGPRPVQFHLAAAAPLFGLGMRQFIDIRNA